MRPSVRFPLLSSAGCAVVFTALLISVYHTAQGRWLDNAALGGFTTLLDSYTYVNAADAIARLCDPAPFALIAATIIGTGLARRQPRRAAAAATLLLGSAVTTQLLKPALASVRIDGHAVGLGKIVTPAIEGPAFPSGHATAAMAIALAALLVAPSKTRPLVATAGAAFALGVGFAIVALGWHFPSDIVGGYLVATAWCLLTLAGLRAADRRWPERGAIREAAKQNIPRPREALLPVAALAGTLALGIALARLDRLAGFAGAHTTATLAAIAIATTGAGLVATIALADRHVR